MLNGKVVIIHIIARLIKKIKIYEMSSFPEPYTYNKNQI